MYHHGKKVPEGTINIMRGTLFGNPFIMGVDGDRDEVVRKFRVYCYNRIMNDPHFRNEVKKLYGETLCCCCAPKACHGDVLARAAAWLNEHKD